MRTIIRVDNKRIKKIIKENLWILNGIGSNASRGKILRGLPNLQTGLIGTVIHGDKSLRTTYELTIEQTATGMIEIHHHAKYTLWIKKVRETGTQHQNEQVETIKWWLSKGVITLEQAKDEYGYKGD